MDGVAIALVVVLFIAFAMVMTVVHFSRAHAILADWADSNSFEILSREHRLFGGRFFLRKSRGQEVYYVTVREANGAIRRGWVRCGGWFLGVFSNRADVIWDE